MKFCSERSPERHLAQEQNKLKQKIASRDAPLPASLLGWPLMTLSLMAIPWLVSVVIAEQTDQPFADAAGSVAGWILDSREEQWVGIGSGFAFLAVITTIVIGMAFSLPPEGVQALPKKNRQLIEVLTFGVALLVALFSAAILWVIVNGQVKFDLVLLLFSAWLVSVVSNLVELKPSASERVSIARRERDELYAGAKDSGFKAGDAITCCQRLGAEFAYWSIPIGGPLFLGGVGLVWDHGGFRIHPVAWFALSILGAGALSMASSWRATTAFKPHKLSARILSWAG